jgi:hypothetical protein
MLSIMLILVYQIPSLSSLALPQGTDQADSVIPTADRNTQADCVSAPEKAAIEVRRKLKYARLTVGIVGYEYGPDGNRNEYIRQVEEYWICPHGWRRDEYRGGRESGSFYKEYVYGGKNGFYSNTDGVVEESTILREGQIRDLPVLSVGFGFGFIYELSMTPGLIFVGTASDRVRSIGRGRIDAFEGTLVSYNTPTNNIVNMVFAEDDTTRLLAGECLGASVAQRELVECEYSNDSWKGFGIPTRVVLSTFREGSLTRVKELAVESLEVFDECPSSVFTLQALGVPGGVSVVNMTEGKQLFFDGQEAVEVTPVSARTLPQGRYWPRWLAIAIVTAVIAAAFFAVVRRPRTDSSN